MMNKRFRVFVYGTLRQHLIKKFGIKHDVKR